MKKTINLREFVENAVKEELNQKNKVFLGYHSSEYEMEGMNKGDILDPSDYSDVIRNAYMDIITDYDKNLENDNIDAMNRVFKKNKYGFTFVSKNPINATSFQTSKYKYGEYLYKVYGNGSEILLDDVHEIGATIVVSKKTLYFEKID